MALHAIPASAAHFTYTAVVMSYNNVTATGIYGNQIVGNAQPYGSNSYEGFVWSNGSVTDIPSTFGIVGVSDNGLAVGTAVENATSYVAYNIPSGQATTIAYAGSPAINIYALGINASGTVAGEVAEPNAHHPKHVLYQGFEQDSAGNVAFLGKPHYTSMRPFPSALPTMGELCWSRYTAVALARTSLLAGRTGLSSPTRCTVAHTSKYFGRMEQGLSVVITKTRIMLGGFR